MAANIEFSNSVPYIKVSIFNAFKIIFVQFHPVLTALKVIYSTSNGGCRREEKSRKHWSFFTKLLFSVTANLSTC